MDVRTYLDKLRVQIAECEAIRDMAMEPKKRELFARLAERQKVLALEIERSIAGGRSDDREQVA